MFGGKLKTWMESRIGRQKKKTERDRGKEKTEKNILESSESLAHSDTGISSGSFQILSSTTDGQEGYCTTTIESEKCGVSHSRTANLSSPESAYSTGYSTDGASPGDATHPEYYINIRTGKHYFPSPAPTPTSPNPHPNPRACITTSFLSTEPRIPPLQTFPTWLAEPQPFEERRPISYRDTPNSDTYKSPKKMQPKSPLSSLKLFLKSPKQDKVKPKPDSTRAISDSKISQCKSKKWYKQPFRFSHKSSDSEVKSDDRKDEGEILKYSLTVPQDQISHQTSGEVASSPRQRNRIRTNPWIQTEPMSSQNFRRLQLNISPSLLRNRSCTNTPLQQRKTPDEPPLQERLIFQCDGSKEYLETLERAVGKRIDQKMFVEISDHSEEDLTLNEMMGTYNESYVYEKETDILSDSDPTDCEDYISDSEANHGGDEDSHDDELDFIDTGSLVEVDENKPNTGRCSYHDVTTRKNSFLLRNRHQSSLDAENRRNSRKEKEAKKRRREEKKRRSIKKMEVEPEVRNIEQHSGEVDLRKVVLQKRMLDKNCSKSAESSPVGLRRKQLSTELKETHIGSPKPREKFDVSFFADFEADKKYNELILEAENMLESLKNTPVMQRRKQAETIPPSLLTPLKAPNKNLAKHSPKRESWRDAPRRSPKNLGLKLSVGVSGSDKKTSFRAKTSAHSPIDPLGPTFRNFSIFKESSSVAKKISSSSSDDSETALSRLTLPPPPPFGFQFVDLGQPASSHCPQSEPVKRKMYTCSKTYDRLVRTFDSPSNSCPRPVPPAFYNPLYSPCARPRPLPSSHLGRRLSSGTELQSK